MGNGARSQPGGPVGAAPWLRQPPAQVFEEARRLHAAGDYARAGERFAFLLSRAPQDAWLMYFCASCRCALGDMKGGKELFERAIRTRPAEVAFHHDLAMAHVKEGDFDRAHACFDRALAIRPDDQTVICNKAETLITQGQADQAIALLRTVLGKAEPKPSLALAFARVAKRLDALPEAKGVIERAMNMPGLVDVQRCGLLFALGETLDGLKDYDAAFDAYRRANAMVLATFDAPGFVRTVDRLIDKWTERACAALPVPPGAADEPVFIVGMPRSGTSLVEQIISSHPRAFGAGERNEINQLAAAVQRNVPGEVAGAIPCVCDPAWLSRPITERVQAEYLRVVRGLAGAGGRPAPLRITDKMPQNFLHLGLIAASFPGARIIHCRREPVDSCLSCYFQNFNRGLGFAFDLANLGAFYVQYERVMAHWQKVLRAPMLEVRYEELVADQEAQSRRLIEFTGLEWNDACLRFHEAERVVMTASNQQVRAPMYRSSVARWKRYEKHLGPLIEALGPFAPGGASTGAIRQGRMPPEPGAAS